MVQVCRHTISTYFDSAVASIASSPHLQKDFTFTAAFRGDQSITNGCTSLGQDIYDKWNVNLWEIVETQMVGSTLKPVVQLTSGLQTVSMNVVLTVLDYVLFEDESRLNDIDKRAFEHDSMIVPLSVKVMGLQWSYRG